MKGVNEMPTFNIGDWNVTESDTEYLLTGGMQVLVETLPIFIFRGSIMGSRFV